MKFIMPDTAPASSHQPTNVPGAAIEDVRRSAAGNYALARALT